MSWRDRPYSQQGYNSPPPQRSGGFAGGMPKPGLAVKYLLIINIVVFFVQAMTREPHHIGPVSALFAVIPEYWWEPWRYITFQFLHGGLLHLLFNMIGLYFLGMLLESGWGARRFLVFYLSCGVVAGIAHVLMTIAMGKGMMNPLLGASGGVYGVVIACAILFPHIRLIVFLFPMPIRTAAALFLGIAVFFTLQQFRAGGDAGGGVAHVAHLGGAVAAVVWVWVLPKLRMKLRFSRRPAGQGQWEKKLKQQREQQEKIDRILDKIRSEGLGSLSRSDKKTLQEATEQQRRDVR